MKALKIVLMCSFLVGCHKDQLDPSEVQATITGFSVGFVACSGGYDIQTKSGQFHSLTLPKPYGYDYSKLTYPATVWIRYKAPTGSCSDFPGLIEITEIRER
jgi:hypothetical protein